MLLLLVSTFTAEFQNGHVQNMVRHHARTSGLVRARVSVRDEFLSETCRGLRTCDQPTSDPSTTSGE